MAMKSDANLVNNVARQHAWSSNDAYTWYMRQHPEISGAPMANESKNKLCLGEECQSVQSFRGFTSPSLCFVLCAAGCETWPSLEMQLSHTHHTTYFPAVLPRQPFCSVSSPVTQPTQYLILLKIKHKNPAMPFAQVSFSHCFDWGSGASSSGWYPKEQLGAKPRHARTHFYRLVASGGRIWNPWPASSQPGHTRLINALPVPEDKGPSIL